MSNKWKKLSWLLALGAAGCAWYHAQEPDRRDLVLGPGVMPQLDYLTPPESFSRIENTKSTLEALSRRVRLETQTKLVAVKRFPTTQCAGQLEAIVEDLKRSMREFAGTEQEFEVAQELLNVLKVDRRFNDWLDLYIRLLYERPMHPLVTHSAADAVVIGRQGKREEQVLDALRFAAAIPVDFAGKNRIAYLLLQASSGTASHLGAVEEATQRGS